MDTDLDKLLRQALNDGASKEEFYRAFLDSQIVVPHANALDELPIVDGVLQEGSALKIPTIEANGQQWMPVFTSPQLLGTVASEPTAYVQLSGRAFLQMTNGRCAVLNPGCKWQKQFLPDEIEAILSGAIFGPGVRAVAIGAEDTVTVGQPACYPRRLAKALRRAFAKRSDVRAAYLACCDMPSHGGRPHTVIGIDTDAFSQVTQEVGPIAQAAIGQDEYVDFTRIRTGDTISDYMLSHTKPFYSASKSGFLRRLFGGR